LFGFAVRMEYSLKNPARGIEKASEQITKPGILTLPEAEALLRATGADLCRRSRSVFLPALGPRPSSGTWIGKASQARGAAARIPQATGLGTEAGSLLFPALRNTGKLSRRAMRRTDAADMLKRRLKQAGLPAHYSAHSFRATGITNFLENDSTLEAAQRIAGHADSRTTKLYDRRGQKVLLEDMERIRY